jgi:hypothetical protein
VTEDDDAPFDASGIACVEDAREEGPAAIRE